MKNITQKLFAILFFIAIAVAFFFALKMGVDRSEQAECIQWREQAAEYPLWYSTQWQREQCEHWKLPLPR